MYYTSSAGNFMMSFRIEETLELNWQKRWSLNCSNERRKGIVSIVADNSTYDGYFKGVNNDGGKLTWLCWLRHLYQQGAFPEPQGWKPGCNHNSSINRPAEASNFIMQPLLSPPLSSSSLYQTNCVFLFLSLRCYFLIIRLRGLRKSTRLAEVRKVFTKRFQPYRNSVYPFGLESQYI